MKNKIFTKANKIAVIPIYKNPDCEGMREAGIVIDIPREFEGIHAGGEMYMALTAIESGEVEFLSYIEEHFNFATFDDMKAIYIKFIAED